jgi:importin subunit beta-1
LASLIKEISDNSNTEAVRQMACLVCKNLISNRSNDSKYADLWVNLEPVFKVNAKGAILSNLVCPSSLVRSQVASLVAAIARIEIPRGEWLELISILCTNATHQEKDIKLASL